MGNLLPPLSYASLQPMAPEMEAAGGGLGIGTLYA